MTINSNLEMKMTNPFKKMDNIFENIDTDYKNQIISNTEKLDDDTLDRKLFTPFETLFINQTIDNINPTIESNYQKTIEMDFTSTFNNVETGKYVGTNKDIIHQREYNVIGNYMVTLIPKSRNEDSKVPIKNSYCTDGTGMTDLTKILWDMRGIDVDSTDLENNCRTLTNRLNKGSNMIHILCKMLIFLNKSILRHNYRKTRTKDFFKWALSDNVDLTLNSEGVNILGLTTYDDNSIVANTELFSTEELFLLLVGSYSTEDIKLVDGNDDYSIYDQLQMGKETINFISLNKNGRRIVFNDTLFKMNPYKIWTSIVRIACKFKCEKDLITADKLLRGLARFSSTLGDFGNNSTYNKSIYLNIPLSHSIVTVFHGTKLNDDYGMTKGSTLRSSTCFLLLDLVRGDSLNLVLPLMHDELNLSYLQCHRLRDMARILKLSLFESGVSVFSSYKACSRFFNNVQGLVDIIDIEHFFSNVLPLYHLYIYCAFENVKKEISDKARLFDAFSQNERFFWPSLRLIGTVGTNNISNALVLPIVIGNEILQFDRNNDEPQCLVDYIRKCTVNGLLRDSSIILSKYSNKGLSSYKKMLTKAEKNIVGAGHGKLLLVKMTCSVTNTVYDKFVVGNHVKRLYNWNSTYYVRESDDYSESNEMDYQDIDGIDNIHLDDNDLLGSSVDFNYTRLNTMGEVKEKKKIKTVTVGLDDIDNDDYFNSPNTGNQIPDDIKSVTSINTDDLDGNKYFKSLLNAKEMTNNNQKQDEKNKEKQSLDKSKKGNTQKEKKEKKVKEIVKVDLKELPLIEEYTNEENKKEEKPDTKFMASSLMGNLEIENKQDSDHKKEENLDKVKITEVPVKDIVDKTKNNEDKDEQENDEEELDNEDSWAALDDDKESEEEEVDEVYKKKLEENDAELMESKDTLNFLKEKRNLDLADYFEIMREDTDSKLVMNNIIINKDEKSKEYKDNFKNGKYVPKYILDVPLSKLDNAVKQLTYTDFVVKKNAKMKPDDIGKEHYMPKHINSSYYRGFSVIVPKLWEGTIDDRKYLKIQNVKKANFSSRLENCLKSHAEYDKTKTIAAVTRSMYNWIIKSKNNGKVEYIISKSDRSNNNRYNYLDLDTSKPSYFCKLIPEKNTVDSISNVFYFTNITTEKFENRK
jgi:hypothetical protein